MNNVDKILRIEESFRGNKKLKDFDGYTLETREKIYYIAISTGQSCCEEYGTIQSNDNLSEFIGSEIKDITYSNCADYSDCEIFEKAVSPGYSAYNVFDCAFIDVNTDIGSFQLAVYNLHNGYYGHDIQVIVEDKVNTLSGIN
jgi:hypothetical protein